MSFHPKEVILDYTNWRGVRKSYRIRPKHIMFGANEWHTEQQWLLEAFTVPDNAVRTFAMKNIHSWTEPTEP